MKEVERWANIGLLPFTLINPEERIVHSRPIVSRPQSDTEGDRHSEADKRTYSQTQDETEKTTMPIN